MPLIYAILIAVIVGVLGFLAGLDVGRADAELLRLYEDDLEVAEDERPSLGPPGPRVMSPTMYRGRQQE